MSETSLIDPLNDPNASIVKPHKKRVGAPNGNRNALRHGYYAKNLGIDPPAQLDEREMRNLLGEVAMLKDYMYILYHRNLESHDSIVLTETLRALAMAGMSLSRLLLVHQQIRVYAPASNSTLKDLLHDMDSAAARAGRISSSLNRSLDDDDDL